MDDFIKITTHKDGTKMDGFHSINTSTLLNPNCRKNAAVPGSICEKCYAETMLNRYKGLRENLADNTERLTAGIIPMELLPITMDRFFRFESFGDIVNEYHFINYLRICEKNPGTNFSIWTKHPVIMKKVFESGYPKPKNLIIILSSLFLNHPMDISIYPFADKVFTVYNCDYAISHNIEINCGGAHCIGCLNCYDPENETIYINEILKSEQKRYYRLLEEKKAEKVVELKIDNMAMVDLI